MKIEIVTELKPCPFCGGEAQMEWYGKNGRIIRCTSCVVQIRQKVIVKTVEWLEEKIIEDWNTRV